MHPSPVTVASPELVSAGTILAWPGRSQIPSMYIPPSTTKLIASQEWEWRPRSGSPGPLFHQTTAATGESSSPSGPKDIVHVRAFSPRLDHLRFGSRTFETKPRPSFLAFSRRTHSVKPQTLTKTKQKKN